MAFGAPRGRGGPARGGRGAPRGGGGFGGRGGRGLLYPFPAKLMDCP